MIFFHFFTNSIRNMHKLISSNHKYLYQNDFVIGIHQDSGFENFQKIPWIIFVTDCNISKTSGCNISKTSSNFIDAEDFHK